MSATFHLLSGFSDALRITIRGAEGLSKQPEDVGDHTVTYGYGYTFLRKSNKGVWSRYNNLDADLAVIGVTLTLTQKNALDAIADSLTQGKGGTAAHAQLINQFAQNLHQPNLTSASAQQLFDADMAHQMGFLKKRLENLLGQSSGDSVYQSLQGTQEGGSGLAFCAKSQDLTLDLLGFVEV